MLTWAVVIDLPVAVVAAGRAKFRCSLPRLGMPPCGMTGESRWTVTWVLIVVTFVVLVVRQQIILTEVKQAQEEAQRAQNQFTGGDTFGVIYMRRDVRALMAKLDVPPPPNSPPPSSG